MKKYPKIPASLKVMTIDEVMAWKASETHTTLQHGTIGINRHGLQKILGVSFSKMYAAINYLTDVFPEAIGKRGENEYIYDLADIVEFIKAHDIKKMSFSVKDYAKQEQPLTIDGQEFLNFIFKTLPEKRPDQLVITSTQIANMKRAKKPRTIEPGTLINRAGISQLIGAGKEKVRVLLKTPRCKFPPVVCYTKVNAQSYYDLQAVIAWTQANDIKKIVFNSEDYKTEPLNIRKQLKQPSIQKRPTLEKMPILKPLGQPEIKSSGKTKTVTVHLDEQDIVSPLRLVDPWHGHNNSHSIGFFVQ